MSIVLYVIGAVAVMAGVGMVAFGIPINEFSFGNTMIVAGTTLASGGLIVVALGAAVAQLQRIAEGLANLPLIAAGKSAESADMAAAAAEAALGMPQPPAAGRMPFPPRPRAEEAREPAPFEPRRAPPPTMSAGEPPPPPPFAPGSRNPEAPPMAAEEETAAMPLPFPPGAAGGSAPLDFPPPPPPARPAPPLGFNGTGGAPEHRAEPTAEPPWRASPPPISPPLPSLPPREGAGTRFDNMWPAEQRKAVGEAPPPPPPPMPPRSERPPREPAAAPAGAENAAGEPARAAILKSGVVDGMGYTLYVDGSIEAELPQGTLRFASIEELRSHLEQHS